MSPDNPHGYDTPPEELYQDVDGDNIDLEQHINQHFRQALRLVEVTESYVHDTLEEEIEDLALLKSYWSDTICCETAGKWGCESTIGGRAPAYTTVRSGFPAKPIQLKRRGISSNPKNSNRAT
ncbi:hypothetical protein [Halobacterium salinarum]|uniref:hypothetical protein n=1 Tax=Halobacterium salinarum TaxID=2242 RepID=UPI0025546EC0|nr:hypothetical protein [Halobacterium salinarum]MDL0135043.1 hypothetical protein [Halobacterium salinarum]